MPGNNINPGTSPTAPKRDLNGFNIETLPAGTQLLFARGGVWLNFSVHLNNPNATSTAPIFFDSYTPAWGGTARPWLNAGMHFAFRVGGEHGNTAVDGGYVIRNLKLDGFATASTTGVFIGNATRDVFIENLEITGFGIAIQLYNGTGPGNNGVTIRNNEIQLNTNMGILGDAFDLLIESNTFRNNNFSGSPFDHAIYLGGHGARGDIRSNVFVDNSVCTRLPCYNNLPITGRCTGGNLTVHGQWDDLEVENNLISQVTSDGGCYGISINSAYNPSEDYDHREWFRELKVRGNTIVNLGNCSICLTSAPGAYVENNVIVNTQNRYHAAILIPDRTPGVDDALDSGAIVRNNSVYLTQSDTGDAISLRAGAGNNLQVVSNLIYFGAGSSSTHNCFAHPA